MLKIIFDWRTWKEMWVESKWFRFTFHWVLRWPFVISLVRWVFEEYSWSFWWNQESRSEWLSRQPFEIAIIDSALCTLWILGVIIGFCGMIREVFDETRYDTISKDDD